MKLCELNGKRCKRENNPDCYPKFRDIGDLCENYTPGEYSRENVIK